MQSQGNNTEPGNSNAPENTGEWWGQFDIPENDWCCWELGELQLFVLRSLNDWHFAWTRDADPLREDVSFTLGGCSLPQSKTLEQARIVMSSGSSELDIVLQLADRAMVARPEMPVFVPVGEKAALLVSTGIWLQLKVNDSLVLDIPINRPSDTWFGQNTREGELCYFSLTRARSSNSGQSILPHRATTPVNVVNNSQEMLRIERLRVPSPLLNLYQSTNGELVTDSLTYILDSEGTDAELEINALSDAQRASQLSRSRQSREEGLVTETLSRIFG